MSAFGERLAAARARAGWSYRRLERVSGHGTSTLFRFETGARVPSEEQARDIARALGEDPDEWVKLARA